jgi:hypothetical protein
MKWLFVVVLVACGGEKKAKPEARPQPVAADAQAAAAMTVLDAAREAVAKDGKREPSSVIALARAEAAANQTDAAKKTLADGIAIARADQTNVGPIALMLAVDALAAVGDTDGAAKLQAEVLADDKAASYPAELYAAVLAAEPSYRPLRDAVIARSIAHREYQGIIDGVAIESPTWNELVAEASKQPVGKLAPLIHLAQTAREAGHPEIAKPLAHAAYEKIIAAKAPDSPWLARELFLVGDTESATKLLDISVKNISKRDDRLRPHSWPEYAELYALFGDRAASAKAESRVLPNVSLAATFALRGDLDRALATPDETQRVAVRMVMYGKLDIADQAIAKLTNERRQGAIAYEVATLATRGDLAAAEKLSLASSYAGFDELMRGYAVRGNAAKLESLAKNDKSSTKSFTLDTNRAIAARVLARQHKCAEAATAVRDVMLRRGEVLAEVARACPDATISR